MVASTFPKTFTYSFLAHSSYLGEKITIQKINCKIRHTDTNVDYF